MNFLRPALHNSEYFEAIGSFFLPQMSGWVYVVCTGQDPDDKDEDVYSARLEAITAGIPMLIHSDWNDMTEELTSQGMMLPDNCDSVLFVGEGAAMVRRVYGDEFDQSLQLLAYPHTPFYDLSHYPVGDFVSISKPGQYFGDVGCIAAHVKQRNMDQQWKPRCLSYVIETTKRDASSVRPQSKSSIRASGCTDRVYRGYSNHTKDVS
jgi:hypothetical protein